MSAVSLKDFDAQLAGFDWFYDYSDDHSVWERGCAAQSRVLAGAKQSPLHKALYDAWEKHHFTGKPWNTEPFTKEHLDAERARIFGAAP